MRLDDGESFGKGKPAVEVSAHAKCSQVDTLAAVDFVPLFGSQGSAQKPRKETEATPRATALPSPGSDESWIHPATNRRSG